MMNVHGSRYCYRCVPHIASSVVWFEFLMLISHHQQWHPEPVVEVSPAPAEGGYQAHLESQGLYDEETCLAAQELGSVCENGYLRLQSDLSWSAG